MEMLKVLEKKVAKLIARMQELAVENEKLAQENSSLMEHINVLEASLVNNEKGSQQEKELAKLAVDELIKSIDSIVSSDQVS